MVCATFWVVTACGVSSPSGPGQKVTIATTAAPALIAFRDGVDAPWQTPVAADVGRYEIEVHGPYTVEDVCTYANYVTILEIARTPDDPRDLEMMCFAEPAPLSHVTGTMVQRGLVCLGPTCADANALANWQFDLATGDGTFDLLARTDFLDGSGDRIVIRRDLAVAGPTTVTPIDAVKEGALLVVLPLTVTNLQPDEMLDLSTHLATRSTPGVIIGDGDLPGAVRVAPDAILLPTDTQRVIVAAVKSDPDSLSYQSVERTLVPGGSTVFTLPPVFDSVQFTVAKDRLLATWSTLPAYDTLRLYASNFDGTIYHQVELSAGYVAATGITGATLDTDIPGYASAWHIDFTKQHTRGATVIKDGAELATSRMREYVNGASLVPAAVRPGGMSASLLEDVWRRKTSSVAGARARANGR